MEWVEVTGRTVAEAKDKALDYLGVDETLAEFEILEEPRVGLFKRLKGEARVRARIKPTHPRPKAERRDRRRGRAREAGERARPARGGERGASAGDRSAGQDDGRSAQSDQPAAEDRPPRDRGRGRGGAGRSGGAPSATSAADGAPPSGPRRRSPGDRAGAVPLEAPLAAAGESLDAPPAFGASDERSPSPTAGASLEPTRAQFEPDPREEDLSAMSDDDRNEGAADDGRQTEHAADFLTGLVQAFGLDASVSTATVDDHYDEVRVDGADLGLLIGQKAATLDAVQELSRVVAQRRSGGRGESRLRVDIAGYRQRRREALERFAIKLADEVRATGVVKALEPMSSADRKVVHDIVGTLDGVSTSSEGEDPRRRVVISPSAG